METEHYCKIPLSRDQRRALFKLRLCSLPLFVETGRYSRSKVPLQDRVCSLCSLHREELYVDQRHELLSQASSLTSEFDTMSSIEKMCFIMNRHELQFLLASTLNVMLKRRKMFI